MRYLTTKRHLSLQPMGSTLTVSFQNTHMWWGWLSITNDFV